MLTIENYHKLLDESLGDWVVTAMKENCDNNLPFYYITIDKKNVPPSAIGKWTMRIQLSRKKNGRGMYLMFIPELPKTPYKEVSAEDIKTLLHIKFRLLQFLNEAGI